MKSTPSTAYLAEEQFVLLMYENDIRRRLTKSCLKSKVLRDQMRWEIQAARRARKSINYRRCRRGIGPMMAVPLLPLDSRAYWARLEDACSRIRTATQAAQPAA